MVLLIKLKNSHIKDMTTLSSLMGYKYGCGVVHDPECKMCKEHK